MNDAQRRIVGVTVLVIGLAIMMAVIEESALRDTFVWIIGAAMIGAIEYYLFAD